VRYGRETSEATSSGEPQRNLLLRSLPVPELEQLAPFLHRVTLAPRRVLQHPGLPIDYLYFVEDGLVSVQAGADARSAVEVWLIGREGVVGSNVLLGADASALRYLVQIEGSALKISVEDLTRALPETPQLRRALHGYLHLALMQSSQVAACSLKHSLQQRLARWMLTAQDRSVRNELPITHDLLARNLGVRRATISEVCKPLERRGIFAKRRGSITILDRAQLEKIACRCYSAMRFRHDGPRASRGPLFWLAMFAAMLELELLAQ
jgi:CRP-like cAMP-binding protein